MSQTSSALRYRPLANAHDETRRFLSEEGGEQK
jgi:hypothetical protein